MSIVPTNFHLCIVHCKSLMLTDFIGNSCQTPKWPIYFYKQLVDLFTQLEHSTRCIFRRTVTHDPPSRYSSVFVVHYRLWIITAVLETYKIPIYKISGSRGIRYRVSIVVCCSTEYPIRATGRSFLVCNTIIIQLMSRLVLCKIFYAMVFNYFIRIIFLLLFIHTV